MKINYRNHYCNLTYLIYVVANRVYFSGKMQISGLKFESPLYFDSVCEKPPPSTSLASIKKIYKQKTKNMS